MRMYCQNGQSAQQGRKQLVCHQISMPDRQSCMQATFFHHIYDSPAKGLTHYLRCYSPALLREHICIETIAVMGVGFGDIGGSSRTSC